jgi:hypothetical protein
MNPSPTFCILSPIVARGKRRTGGDDVSCSAHPFHDDDPPFFQQGLRLTCRCGAELNSKKLHDPPDTEFTNIGFSYTMSGVLLGVPHAPEDPRTGEYASTGGLRDARGKRKPHRLVACQAGRVDYVSGGDGDDAKPYQEKDVRQIIRKAERSP